jgi:hypothetical protein
MRSLIVQRETYRLTAEELLAFRCLGSWPPDGAFKFWKRVAVARALDYRTILCKPDKPGTFSALPIGHRKHWCWPMELTCAPPPKHFAYAAG